MADDDRLRSPQENCCDPVAPVRFRGAVDPWQHPAERALGGDGPQHLEPLGHPGPHQALLAEGHGRDHQLHPLDPPAPEAGPRSVFLALQAAQDGQDPRKVSVGLCIDKPRLSNTDYSRGLLVEHSE